MTCRRVTLAIVVVLATLAGGVGPSAAQGPADSPSESSTPLSESQKQLNEEGVAAIIAGDFDRAVLRFRSSLTLGPTNVIYLNLGRAYARGGHCREALAAYGQVEGAPNVPLPSAEEVAQVLVRFIKELDPEHCPADITLVCHPAEMQVRVDGGQPGVCPSAPFPLPAGEHRFVGSVGDETVAETVTVEALDSLSLALTLDTHLADLPPRAAPLPWWGTPEILGWAVGGTGLLTLGAAFVVDRTIIKDEVDSWNGGEVEQTASRRRHIEDLQDYNTGVIVVGALFTVTGSALLAADVFGEDPGTAGPELQIGAEGARVGWRSVW